MRALGVLCAAVAAAAVVGSAGAAGPNAGTLSIEQGKGTVTLDVRGSILGRLANGTLRVVDQTPKDRFVPFVVGKRMTTTKLGPKTTLYKGKELRFRMLGGGTRLVIKGSGISVSAVGRGWVILDGDPRFVDDVTGYYSLDGADCKSDVTLCAPLPELPERYVLGPQKPKPVPGRGAAK